MSAGDGGVTESVGDADGVGRVHQGGDLVGVNPADCHGFGAVAVDGADWGAAEDEGDDAEAQVLVDAGEAVDVDVEAGLFEDFAVHAVLELLAEFEDPAGWFPVAVVAALDHEDLSGVIDDDPGDTDGVPRCVRHLDHLVGPSRSVWQDHTCPDV